MDANREKKLTAKQEDLLRVLATWCEPGLPLLSKLAARLGYASEAGVRRHLDALEARGFVMRVALEAGGAKAARVPRLVARGRDYLQLPEAATAREFNVSSGFEFGVPLHPIRCGAPVEGNGEIETLSITHLFPGFRPGDAVMLAEGDSMIAPDGEENAASIFPGDLVWKRPGIKPANGELVHAEHISEFGTYECTLKVFSQCEYTGAVTLHALNPKYSDIVIAGTQVEVRGVVLGVRRLTGQGK